MNITAKLAMGGGAAALVGFLAFQFLTSAGDIGGRSRPGPEVSPAIKDEAPAGCGFPLGTRLAFSGETSLHEAGLALIDDPNESRQGDLYVTAAAIHVEYDPRRDQGRYCLIFPPRAGHVYGDLALGPVPRDWAAPIDFGSRIPAAEGTQP